METTLSDILKSQLENAKRRQKVIAFLEINGYDDDFSQKFTPQLKRVIGKLVLPNDWTNADRDVFRDIFPQPQGAAPTKKARHEGLESERRTVIEAVERRISASNKYYEELLIVPDKLPIYDHEIRKFLSLTTFKLPLVNLGTSLNVNDPETVTLNYVEAANSLASFCETFLDEDAPNAARDNEATASHFLCNLTGNLFKFLNRHAPRSRKLNGFRFALDSANDSTTANPASKPLNDLLRPDFQLFVKGCLILRWDNKAVAGDLAKAVTENTSKLKAWSSLFYGNLPYVLGGACAGLQFVWLKLYPGEHGIILQEEVSEWYDLAVSTNVAKFLHSVVQMHCLLLKLQQKLDGQVRVTLYEKLDRFCGDTNCGVIQFYPDCVQKDIIPALERERLGLLVSMYDEIHASRYLIKLKSHRQLRGLTRLVLAPLGDPRAEPVNLTDLESFTHDMLIALADLHKAGYTHRDIRWPNCILVNLKSDFHWVLIDLEEAGPAGEEWVKDPLRDWDDGTLEVDPCGKSYYTKGSDMYQLGNLIVKWLETEETRAGCDKTSSRREKMNSLGERMKKRTPAAALLQDICKKYCPRCGVFGMKM